MDGDTEAPTLAADELLDIAAAAAVPVDVGMAAPTDRVAVAVDAADEVGRLLGELGDVSDGVGVLSLLDTAVTLLDILALLVPCADSDADALPVELGLLEDVDDIPALLDAVALPLLLTVGL